MPLFNLEGKKTYIVSVGAIAYAIGGLVSGYLDLNTAIQVVLAALGLGALKHATVTGADMFEEPKLPPNPTTPSASG